MTILHTAAPTGGPAPTTAAAVRAAVEATTAWQEASTGGQAIAAALEVARAAPTEILDTLAGASQVVITGAGSSYYIAQVASVALRARCGLPAVAAPLSEVLLRPEAVFAPGEPSHQPVIVVSRSGTTTEALDVIRARPGARGSRHRRDLPARRAPWPSWPRPRWPIPEGDETAIVMTRSFASQTALLMRLGAGWARPASRPTSMPCRRTGRTWRPSSSGPSSWQRRTHRESWCWAAGLPTAWPTRPS